MRPYSDNLFAKDAHNYIRHSPVRTKLLPALTIILQPDKQSVNLTQNKAVWKRRKQNAIRGGTIIEVTLKSIIM